MSRIKELEVLAFPDWKIQLDHVAKTELVVSDRNFRLLVDKVNEIIQVLNEQN